ncbi:hypothetical protein RB195_014633 [Necator americanus]|uniref:Reverse transcriptase domain-containing protein n=1 Tax=Necator americanus TaxID=51031 RepID=A0ABR1E3P7_NECAM
MVPKLFAAALQWIMQWIMMNNHFLGKKRDTSVDERLLSSLHFAEDIVLFSKSASEAETMLNGLNELGKRIGLRINRKKTQFMTNPYCEDRGVQLEGFQILETP